MDNSPIVLFRPNFFDSIGGSTGVPTDAASGMTTETTSKTSKSKPNSRRGKKRQADQAIRAMIKQGKLTKEAAARLTTEDKVRMLDEWQAYRKSMSELSAEKLLGHQEMKADFPETHSLLERALVQPEGT